MKEKGQSVTVIVSVAVMAILVAALISSLADESQKKTTTTGVVNEVHAATINGPADVNTTKTYTVTHNPTGWKSEDCPLTNFVLKNQSGTTFTLTTDYLVTLSTGVYTLKNTTATINGVINSGQLNNTYASYSYCADDYLNSSWGRNLLNLTPGLIAIALLVAVIGGAYMLLRKEEVD